MMKPPKPPKPAGSEPEMYDLQADLKIWAIDTFLLTATKEQKKYDLNDLDLRLIWDDVVVTHEPAEYYDEQIHRLPKAQVLFSTTFRNNTDSDQEYSFRTERCTRSIAEMEIQRGVVISKEMSLKLTLPNNILEANAGFRHELSLGSASRQSTEEELTWGVDTRIIVHARSAAFAEVKVAEEQMTSQFRLVTTMQGRIRAVFVDATRNQAFVKYIEGDLATIVESMLSKRRPPSNPVNPKPQVWVETRKNGNRVLMIETSGKCMFRFGVHQEVEVNQKPT
ncbi:LIN 24 Twenty four Like family member [Paragonimus skrjabini miyazakii]|uniref:LIN 24 Twenty four Like family member n=1 Tax=Paragonimus skrjabini miyazakii TaxID=59628 RepID=A0A8S9Z077_9TREM|nr:LIN 24 Twenty four Like family member [Paragonimus skrjabini miyazakii]